MKVIIFDDNIAHEGLLPLTFTRPVSEIRIGITTITEKWSKLLSEPVSWLTSQYLAEKYPMDYDRGDALFVAGNIVPEPSERFRKEVMSLKPGEALVKRDVLVAAVTDSCHFAARDFKNAVETKADLVIINRPYDIFLNNGNVLRDDYAQLDLADSTPLSPTNRVIGPTTDENGRPLIYLAPGAKAECAVFNTTHGPIYIGRDAEVMEGCTLRGPVALCEHGVFNMQTKVYPDTTIGPWCKVGGELNNVVMIGYSNKAHDGFLGNAVIGEWCNLGAGCVASNLKNDYSNVRVWNYREQRFEKTPLQFCGLIMGDHSKAGINTMFNTATVVGVGANIHGAGFPRTYVASFSAGGAVGFTEIPLEKMFATAERVMARRHKELTEADRSILRYVKEHTEA